MARATLMQIADRLAPGDLAPPAPTPPVVVPPPAAVPPPAPPLPTAPRFVDASEYRVTPFADVPVEARRAKQFWSELPLDPYYFQFQPQTLLLIHLLQGLRAESAFELGCNVGRNVFWLARAIPGLRITGVDVNPRAIAKGREVFGLGANVISVGDESALADLPARSIDVIYTVSVLDHLPRVDTVLGEMVRVAKKRVILIELVLPKTGVIDDPRCVQCSYSHDYPSLVAALPARIASHAKTPLGPEILEHYQTLEIEPR